MSTAALALLLLPAVTCASSHSQVNNPDSLQLSPGVIVDLQQRRLYLMSPENAVEAVNIDAGETVWTSSEAAKPLLVKDGTLVCQAETPEANNTLRLVVLDANQGGERIIATSVKLPEQVRSFINDDVSNKFFAQGIVIDDDSFVAWQHESYPVRGISPRAEAEETGVRLAIDEPRQSSGAVKIDHRSGKVTTLSPRDVAKALQEIQPTARTNLTGAPPDPSQRVSIDGRHTLKSALVADDREWEKYQWTIVDNSTGESIGQIRSHLSQSGFVVVASQIIFETGAYVRRTEAGIVNEPLMVRAVDLMSGEQVWSRALRDTAYRGSYPP